MTQNREEVKVVSKVTKNKDGKGNPVKMLDNKVKEIVSSKELSKSEKIRRLYDLELEIGAIAKLLQIRYQFAYNVADSYTDGEIRKVSRKPSKSALFRELYDKGFKVHEIATKTSSNYNFVHSVIKKYKNS
ncbi:MAG: hypothetical protein WC239_06025 [Sphaerochaetaceae bacterium]